MQGTQPRTRAVGRNVGAIDDVVGSLSDRELFVVSNRQPYAHSRADDGVSVDRPTGGLTAGLDPFVRAVDGTWIAWGDGDADADVVDGNDRVRVPPDEPRYTLRRVWLSDEDVRDYYYGFSNRVLWPICHCSLDKVHGEPAYWRRYRAVNETFADVVSDELEGTSSPIVWFQDYHLAMAPRMARPDAPSGAVFAHFWHVPWPSWDVFRACPHGRPLLRGLLGNDLVGFHVERYEDLFLDCVDRALDGASVDRDAGIVRYEGEVTETESIPLGVDAERIARTARDATDFWPSFAARHDVRPDVRVALGVERLDYSKGIPARLRALERFWETHPAWRGNLTYVQKGSESRSRIPAYEAVQRTVRTEVDRINARFGTDGWTPIVYTTDRLSREQLYSLYRRADLALVTPIRDGLNLVAQEYVAAQVDGPGVLVLSDQAGVHDRMGEHAVSVSPHDVAGVAAAVSRALDMPTEERRRRMRALRSCVARDSLSNWVRGFVGAATSAERRRPATVGG